MYDKIYDILHYIRYDILYKLHIEIVRKMLYNIS